MRCQKRFLLLIVCFLFFSSLQSVTATSHESNQSLDRYVDSFLEEHQIPGASIILYRDDKIFFAKERGITGETEHGVTLNTPFTIGSISKSLTALGIMKLVEEGQVQLDGSVKDYLPWFELKDAQAPIQITIEHLLTHTSGISTYDGLRISDGESDDMNAIKRNVIKLLDVELTAAPGEIHQYSNANYAILGAIIEEVTGQSYSSYMEHNIFTPLGMTDTAADRETAYEKGYSSGYQSWFGIPTKSTVSYDNGGAPYGYVTASANDLMEYIKFLTRQDDIGFLSEDGMNQFLSPHFQINENKKYGFGWRFSKVDNIEDGLIWHSGSTPDSHSEIFFSPDLSWGGIILTNRNHILEELALFEFKQEIISFFMGEEPEPIAQQRPVIQIITLGVAILLLVWTISVGLMALRNKKRSRVFWGISSLGYLGLSIAMIPIFTSIVDSPWNAIHAFAPDLAFLVQAMVLMLFMNGVISTIIVVQSLKLTKGRASCMAKELSQKFEG
ncbi:serine hydrolase [Bacillus carboniphilus]|uniref:Serine hydrolase n=1 Tax=Bacillus carboniphilus TaxID=86663 RepID=A0ABP3GGG4_9BACI